jgi:hypothetical protein
MPDLASAAFRRGWRYARHVARPEPAVTDHERRKAQKTMSDMLKSELNPDQRDTLGELEKFGWELRFVRHDPEQRPVPVIFDSEHTKFAVLDQDGSLDENAFVKLRE